jgi:hypothetical protein
MPLNPPLSLEEVNANRARIGDPPLEPPTPDVERVAVYGTSDELSALLRADVKSRDLYKANYVRYANARADRFRDEAKASHKYDQQVELTAIERSEINGNRLSTVAGMRGQEWYAMWAVATEIMDHYGLHQNVLEDDVNDIDDFYHRAENALEYNSGYVKRHVFKRQGGR